MSVSVSVCVCVCARACGRVFVPVCVCVFEGGGACSLSCGQHLLAGEITVCPAVVVGSQAGRYLG